MRGAGRCRISSFRLPCLARRSPPRAGPVVWISAPERFRRVRPRDRVVSRGPRFRRSRRGDAGLVRLPGMWLRDSPDGSVARQHGAVRLVRQPRGGAVHSEGRPDRGGRDGRGRGGSRGGTGGAWPISARLAVTLLSLALAAALLTRIVRSQWQSAAEADAAADGRDVGRGREGRPARDALVELQAALARAAAVSPPPPGVDDLRRRRHDLVAPRGRGATCRLAHAGERSGQAVGQALTLQTRAGTTRPSAASCRRSRPRWSGSAGSGATPMPPRRPIAAEAGRPDRAMELCERLYRTADGLPDGPRRRLQAGAAELATRVIARHGAIIEPVKGQFTLGSPGSYASDLRPLFLDGLRSHGYLPRPASPSGPSSLEPDPALPARVRGGRARRTPPTSSRRTGSAASRAGWRSPRGSVSLWHDTPMARTPVPLPGSPPSRPAAWPPVPTGAPTSSGSSTTTPWPACGNAWACQCTTSRLPRRAPAAPAGPGERRLGREFVAAAPPTPRTGRPPRSGMNFLTNRRAGIGWTCDRAGPARPRVLARTGRRATDAHHQQAVSTRTSPPPRGRSAGRGYCSASGGWNGGWASGRPCSWARWRRSSSPRRW